MPSIALTRHVSVRRRGYSDWFDVSVTSETQRLDLGEEAEPPRLDYTALRHAWAISSRNEYFSTFVPSW